MNNSCYICGATDDLTRDHVPPKNLFPDPKPSNLITVPCCRRCNVGFSKDDELFRIWASSGQSCSLAGKWIWRNKVAPSLETRNKKLKEHLKKNLGTAKLDALLGGIEVPTFGIPVDRANPFIIRLTKGLLRHFHPDYDYGDIPFLVNHLAPKPKHLAIFAQMTSLLSYDERGDGVFRFWHGFAKDAPNRGVWVYLF